jgi:ABC-type transport system involved in multi-copper enzyme maturation permease subunit
MRNLITSEARKLLTTRSMWGLLAGTTLLSGLAAWAITANLDLTGPIGLSGLPGFQEMMALVPAFVLVLGIRSYTDEARHGSVVPTLLSSPVRRRVVGAKAVVVGAAAMTFAVAGAASVIAVSSLVLTLDGVAVTMGSLGALIALIAKVVGVCLLWSTIGLGVGMAVSHQVAAIVGSLVWLFVVENLLDGLAPNLARILPGHAGMSALGIASYDTLAPPTAAGLLVGWAAVCLVLGAGRFQRRDIA